MMLLEFDSPQVHDLLEIESGSLATGSIAQPPWVRKMLIDCPWVVVRRGEAPAGYIAVGVRGGSRGERGVDIVQSATSSALPGPAIYWLSAARPRTFIERLR